MKSLEKIDPMIPQTNPAALVEKMRTEIDEAIKRVLGSGRYILGSEVEAFEKEWADWCDVKKAVGCANGTDGLELILKSINIPKNSRVLAPSHTAVATISAIVRAGYRPYLADVDLGTFTLDLTSVERCLIDAEKSNDPIKALIAVHLYGQPCELDELETLCTKHKVILVEDASQAHGARWKGKRVGGFGIAAAFSLYPTKNLGALGDAGVVTTNNKEIAQRIKEIRQYGWRERAISEEPGINSRLDPIQAAVLRAKLPMLEAHNAHRKAIADVYRREFNNSEMLEMLPKTDKRSEHVYHQFVVKLLLDGERTYKRIS